MDVLGAASDGLLEDGAEDIGVVVSLRSRMGVGTRDTG